MTPDPQRDLLLLIETSGPTSSVALAQRTDAAWTVLAQAPNATDEPPAPMQHTAQLLPLIRSVLPPEGWARLAAVGTSSGPGSYTALRAGLSTAKGICAARGLPLLQASTMRGVASVARGGLTPKRGPEGRGGGGTALVLLPARRSEVYAATYALDDLRERSAPAVVENDAAWREGHLSTGVTVVCGPDPGLLASFDRGGTQLVEVPLEANNLLTECALRISENRFDGLANTVPLYVRPPYITRTRTRL